MYPFDHVRRYIFTVASLVFVVTGCQTTMTSSSAGESASPDAPSMFPLKFNEHAFAAHCYNTLRCRVIYSNFDFNRSNADKPSPSPPPGDYWQHWPYASYAGIRNFPPAAEVQWTSLDGVAHEAKVDMGTIFQDERVLYRVPDTEIPDQSWGGSPGIFLEVNDRTINVYMQAIISTKNEQIPGNKYSNYRDDVILAWSHTY